MDKVRVIKRSLYCYRLSWFALIPFLGVVPAIICLTLFRRIGNEAGEDWNPGRTFAVMGSRIAITGLLGSSLVGGAILVYCVEHYPF